jgi:hypothetical protein
MDRRCSFLHCAKPGVVTLGDCQYCLAHFISTCYQHLEEFPGSRRADQQKEGEAKVQRGSLLDEITEQATAVALSTNDLNNQERGQLLDILLWANDLLSGGRR